MSHTTAEVLGPLVANPYPPSWPSSAFVIAVPLVRDIAWGGPGVVAGTVKVVGSPNSPVRRRVRLLRDKDGFAWGKPGVILSQVSTCSPAWKQRKGTRQSVTIMRVVTVQLQQTI